MSEVIESVRNAMRRLGNQGSLVAYPYGGPFKPASLVEMPSHIQEKAKVASQAVDGVAWHALQDLNTSSSTFGQFFFVPGIDYPEDPTKVHL